MAARGYLVRRVKKTNNSGHKSAKGHRKKKLPPWDNSISNLLVYRSTQDELRRRHDIHQPIPREFDSVYDVSEQYASSDVYAGLPKTPESVNDERCSVLREMMSSNEKLQDALTYSDKRMSVVQDMFGDDPKKFRGFPNITSAPAQAKQRYLRGGTLATMAAFTKEPSLGLSNLDILSDTVMDETALNDVTHLNRHILEDENNNVKEMIKTDNNYTPERCSPESYDNQKSFKKCERTSCDASCNTEHFTSPASSQLSRSTVLAGAPDIQENTRPQMKHDRYSTVTATQEDRVHLAFEKMRKNEKSPNQSKLTSVGPSEHRDLRQMIDDLQEEVKKYEEEIGQEQYSLNTKVKEKGSFTVSMLNVVTKLVGYLREYETQRKADMSMKEEILYGFQQQQILIDALTNDVIYLQEENKMLQHELRAYENTTNQEIAYLKRELYAVVKNCEYSTPPSQDTFHGENPTYATNEDLSSNQQPVLISKITENQGLRDKLRYPPDVAGYNSSFGVLPGRNTCMKEREVEQDTTGTNKEDIIAKMLYQNVETVAKFTKNNTSVNHQTNIANNAAILDRRSMGNSDYDYLKSYSDHQLPSPTTILPTTFSEFISTNPLLSGDVISTVPRDLTSESPHMLLPSFPSQHATQYTTSLQPSVFLGRNHSMSPHSHLPKHEREERQPTSLTSQIRLNTNENSSIEELSKSTFKAPSYSDTHHVKRQILLTDEVPAKGFEHPNQSKTSPASPVFYDDPPVPPSMGLRPSSGEKMVVTLPSMWEDTKSPQNTARKNTSASMKPGMKGIGRQKTDQGWFALSTYVDQS